MDMFYDRFRKGSRCKIKKGTHYGFWDKFIDVPKMSTESLPRIGGELDQLAQAIRQNERQLAEGRLRDADKKYYEKKVELRCRQHVIGDLDKYYRALDWAIMQYHRDRMKIINRIVKELWRATYRGNDIDYIEIKTDETDGVSAGADKRKVYNYKVCLKNKNLIKVNIFNSLRTVT